MCIEKMLDTRKLLDPNADVESNSDQLEYPQPLSFLWRIVHWSGYITGGVTFALGSLMYFPSISNYVAGGWLFTIGSFGFFCADSLEWWTNNRVGCFHYAKYENSYEKSVGPFLPPKDTFNGKYQRAVNGINFFCSLIGSTLYLIGSILFIPSLDTIVLGTWVFIFGSLVIFLAQSWKFYRAGIYDEDSPSSTIFKFNNLLHDLPGVIVDVTAGLGGFCYLIGSILFLPQYDINDAITTLAATWFEFGGIFYTISGLTMFYRYFFTLNYPH